MAQVAVVTKPRRSRTTAPSSTNTEATLGYVKQLTVYQLALITTVDHISDFCLEDVLRKCEDEQGAVDILNEGVQASA